MSVLKAVSVLKNESGIAGVIHFSQSSNGGSVHVKGEVKGLTPGEHGFHIHEFGDSTNGCISAGPHFNLNPEHHHGGPTSAKQHNGDLGNIFASDQGVAAVDLKIDRISLIDGDKEDIKGRSLVLHDKKDDLGLGGDEESLKTGNAGGRIACGIIGRAKSA